MSQKFAPAAAVAPQVGQAGSNKWPQLRQNAAPSRLGALHHLQIIAC